jgi:hypothetical protein
MDYAQKTTTNVINKNAHFMQEMAFSNDYSGKVQNFIRSDVNSVLMRKKIKSV